MSGIERGIDLMAKARGDAPKEAISLTRRRETIQMRYTDPEGQEYSGALVSEILDGDTRLLMGQRCAAMARGSWDHLPVGTQSRIVALVQVAFQIKDPPAWFSQWVGEDDVLLFGTWGRCEEHAQRYFCGDYGAGPKDQGKPRLEFVEAGTS